MRALNNGKPQLNASENTTNIRNKNIYADAKSSKTNQTNYDGTIIYNTTNNGIKNYINYEMYMNINYGYNLCVDCSGICSNTPLDPDIQTENNQFSVMEFQNTTDRIIFDNDYDGLLEDEGNLNGDGIFIDKNNIIFGNSYCTRKNYLNFMKDLSGVDISGNDTNQNYLRCMDFPNNVKL
jgi:hypothetical protein